ncbi:VacJ family lipoprotein [Paraburkholderia flava]|uniref:MlaA family lipoprotein n=1 Tax=Paraburkholderia flava TaxID=2547393 RepID=UPI00105F25A5|nr:VacJ family lipoprotein [Paraburkholderia flava]
MKTLRVRNAALVLAVATLAACSTVQTPIKEDPLEGFNRTVFKLNDTVDEYALKPVAKGYVFITPQPVRDSVTNFFSNIGDVYTAANNLLQLKITDGVEDIMRVVINTIFGVGGLFDVATLAKLPKHNNDFGLTLGHYGVPAGPYLVLPLFGPSTVRDTVGLIGNYYISPLSYVDPAWLSWSLYFLNVVNTRANLLGAGDVLNGAALDKYSFVRNAYLQRRKYQLTDGSSAAGLPDYGDGAPPPKYEDVDDAAAAGTAGTAGAAAGASATAAPAAAASGAAAPTSASGAEAPNPASNTNVPAGDMVPPARFGYPSLKLR